jgi:hypothetical protein
MKAKLFIGLAVAVVAIAATTIFAVNHFSPKSQLSDLALQNLEAITGSESWWDSKIYDCVSVEAWVFTCMFYKDIPRNGVADWEIGGPHDPYEICCGLFLLPSVDCVSGNSVAHCWDC